MTIETSERLWRADRSLADACLRHPFVRGLADGSLPSWRYKQYVAQDAFFLRAFVHAYGLAGARAEDAEGMRLYRELAAGVEEELSLHRGVAQRLGIDLESVRPAPATLAYTDFLLATAATRSEPCAAAAMLPCLRLYAWLGQQLRPSLVSESPWGEWVETYADPGFDALWRRLAPRLEGAECASDELADIHRRAMTLELRFFEAAWGGDAPHEPPTALTVAGSDPSGGAGVQADLKTFHRYGVYGQSVITLLTAQNTRGVEHVHVEAPSLVAAQLDSVLGDLGARAAKTGALGAVEVVTVVAEKLRERPVGALVVDPVLVSKHGHDLAAPDVAAALSEHLLPLAAVVTPNRFEVEKMTGIAVRDRDTAAEAAATLKQTGVGAVVVKDVPGLEGDLLCSDAGVEAFARPHIDSVHRHGSGCTFSAAITAALAHGRPLPIAVAEARDFIVRAIASAPGFGEIGPVNHWA